MFLVLNNKKVPLSEGILKYYLGNRRYRKCAYTIKLHMYAVDCSASSILVTYAATARYQSHIQNKLTYILRSQGINS
jgi:hypothetical protein